MSYAKIARGLIFLAIVFIAGNACALEPPIPAKSKASQEPQKQTAAAKNNSTDTNKFTEPVRPISAVYNQSYTYNVAAKPSNEPSEDWWIIPDWWIVIFTAVIVAIGFGQVLLFRAQLIIMNKSLKDTELAATAAKESVDIANKALTEYERPWLCLDRIHVKGREHIKEEYNWFIDFKIKNIGRMPAIIEELLIKIQDIGTLPEIPDYSDIIPMSHARTLAVGDSFDTRPIGPSNQVIDGKTINYAVFGRITYKELNGRTHTSGFAVEVCPNFAAATSCRHEAYTYYN